MVRCGTFALFLLLAATAAAAGPTLILPANITAEAIGPQGAYVTYVATSNGVPVGEDENGRGATASCAPASGSLFPLGTTTVACTARDEAGSTSSGAFLVQVRDTTAPALTAPESISVDAGSDPSAAVTFSASATDLVDGPVSVVCTPPSGSTFFVGTTIVSCSATDAHGNTAGDAFSVAVTGSGTASLILQNISAEATSPDGAVVSFEGIANNGGIRITCTPPSGSTFALGETNVACTAEGGLSGSFVVRVADTTPPALSLPGTIFADATMPAGAVVTYTATASDLVDGSVAIDCTPPSGSTFAVGTTTVNCTASDSRGNTAGGSFEVNVVDVDPPSITSVSATPNVLWPPNHQMVPVSVSVTATDNVDFTPTCQIYLITSNEPVTNAFDWTITGQLTASLRAERTGGGSGRVYTIHVECLDDAANRSTSTVTVSVPHDRRRP